MQTRFSTTVWTAHPPLFSTLILRKQFTSYGRIPSSPPSWITAASSILWIAQASACTGYLIRPWPHLLRSFFTEVKRIGRSGYVPDETDVLRARLKSTGITETRFNMGQLSYVISFVSAFTHARVTYILFLTSFVSPPQHSHV